MSEKPPGKVVSRDRSQAERKLLTYFSDYSFESKHLGCRECKNACHADWEVSEFHAHTVRTARNT